MAGNPQRRGSAPMMHVASPDGMDAGDAVTTTHTNTIKKIVTNAADAERSEFIGVDWTAQPHRLFSIQGGAWVFLLRVPRRLVPEELEREHGRGSFRQVPIFTRPSGREEAVEEFAVVEHIGVPTSLGTQTHHAHAPALAPSGDASMMAALPALLSALRSFAPAPTVAAPGADPFDRWMQAQAAQQAEDRRREEERRAEERDQRRREDERRDREAEMQRKRDEDAKAEERRRDDERRAERAALIQAAIVALPTLMGMMRPEPKDDSIIVKMLEQSAAAQDRLAGALADRKHQPQHHDKGADQMIAFLTSQMQSLQAQLMQALNAPKPVAAPTDPLAGMGAMMAQMKMLEQMQRFFVPDDRSDDDGEDDEPDPLMQAAIMAFVGKAQPDLAPVMAQMMTRKSSKRHSRDDDDDDDDDNPEAEADRLFAHVASKPALASVVQRRLADATAPAQPSVALPGLGAQDVPQGTASILERARARAAARASE